MCNHNKSRWVLSFKTQPNSMYRISIIEILQLPCSFRMAVEQHPCNSERSEESGIQTKGLKWGKISYKKFSARILSLAS